MKLKKIITMAMVMAMSVGSLPVSSFADVITPSTIRGQANPDSYAFKGQEKLDWESEFKKEDYNWPLADNQKLVRMAASDALSMVGFNYVGQYTDGKGRTVIRLELRNMYVVDSVVWRGLELRFDEKLRDMIDFNESGFITRKGNVIKIPNSPDDRGVYKMVLNNKDGEVHEGGTVAGTILNSPLDIVLNEGADLSTIGRDSYAQLRVTDSKHVRVYARSFGEIPLDYTRYTVTAGIPTNNKAKTEFRKGEMTTQGTGNFVALFMKAANLSVDYSDKKNLSTKTKDVPKGENNKYYSTLSFQYDARKDYLENVLKGEDRKYGLAFTFDKKLVDFLKREKDGQMNPTTVIGETSIIGDNGKYIDGEKLQIRYQDINIDGDRAFIILRPASSGLDLPSGYKPINIPDDKWNSRIITNNYNSFTRINWFVDIDKMEEFVNNTPEGQSGGTAFLNLDVQAGILVENKKGWIDYEANIPKNISFGPQSFLLTELSDPINPKQNERNNQIQIKFGSNANQQFETIQGHFAGLDADGVGGGFDKRVEGMTYGGDQGRYFVTKNMKESAWGKGMLNRGRSVKAGDKVLVTIPNTTNYNGQIKMWGVNFDDDALANGVYGYTEEKDDTLKIRLYSPDDINKVKITYLDKNNVLKTVENELKGIALTKHWSGGYDNDGVLYNPKSSGGILEIDVRKASFDQDINVEYYFNDTSKGTATIKQLPEFTKVAEKYTKPTYLFNSDTETPFIIGKADYLPKQKIIFTDTDKFTGYSRFQNARVIFNGIEATNGNHITGEGLSGEDVYDKNGNLQSESTGEDVKFKEGTYRAYPYDIAKPAELGQMTKDMPLYFSNNNSSSLQSDSKIERVHAKVTFDLEGGNIPTDKPSLVTRNKVTDDLVRIVPDNKLYNNGKKYDPKTRRLVKVQGEDYKPNGFSGDNIQFIEQDTGKELSNEEKALRKMPIDPIAPKAQEGEILLGWSTKEGTTEEDWKTMESAKTLDQVNDTQKAYKFTSKSPVDKNMKVYAVYGKEPVVIIPDDPNENPKDGYHRVTFDPGDGSFAEGTLKVFDILNGKTIQEAKDYEPKFVIPTPQAPNAKEFKNWKVNTDKYKKDLTDYKKPITDAVTFLADYVSLPGIPVQKYNKDEDKQFIEGTATGINDGTEVTLLGEDNMPINDSSGNPIKGTVSNGKYIIDLTNLSSDDKMKLHGKIVFAKIDGQDGKSETSTKLDLKAPVLKLTLTPDTFNYKGKLTGSVTDEDSGILSLKHADSSEAIEFNEDGSIEKYIDLLGNDVSISAVATDKMGNKTEDVTVSTESILEKFDLKIRRSRKGQKELYIKSIEGVNYEITVISSNNKVKMRSYTSTKSAYEKVSLIQESDGSEYTLKSKDRIVVVASKTNHETQQINTRVR